MLNSDKQKGNKKLSLSTDTLLEGTLTLIFWTVHLGLFSSGLLISSEMYHGKCVLNLWSGCNLLLNCEFHKNQDFLMKSQVHPIFVQI